MYNTTKLKQMKGISLRSLKGQLHTVNPQNEDCPMKEIENIKEKLAFCKRHIATHYKGKSFDQYFKDLPFKLLRNFSFDDLCKMGYHTCHMHDSVKKILTHPQHVVVQKIKSSMWRWGFGRATWNDIVDVYSRLQTFSFLEHPDFDIRIDLTTGYNEKGYSRYSRTFLDGVFAILVYYKREHVLTIGFSFMKGRQILIQQVQLRRPTGNRWLYKIPKNRIEFVIDMFQRNFAGYRLFIVDGKILVEQSLSSYQRALDRSEKSIQEYKRLLKQQLIPEGLKDSYARRYKRDKEDAEHWKQKLEHLKADTKRLVDFYASAGQHMLGEALHLNELTHYQIIQQSAQMLQCAV